MKVFVTFLLITQLVQLNAATYYIDYVGGSNAAAGTSTGTAWKHCPGDLEATGNPASYTPQAGDIFIFKGGSAYGGSVELTRSGNDDARIQYIGNPDGSWGTGAGLFNHTNRNDITSSAFRNPDDQAVSFLVISNFTLTEIGGYTDAELAAIEAAPTTNAAPKRSGVGISLGNGAVCHNINIYKITADQIGTWENSPKYHVETSMSGSAISITGGHDIWMEDIEVTKSFTGVNFQGGSLGEPLYNIVYTNFNHHNYIRWTVDLKPRMGGTLMSNIWIINGTIRDYHEYDSGNWLGIGEKPHTDGIFVRNDSVGNTWTNIFIDGVNFYSDPANYANSAGGTAHIFVSQGPSVTIQNCRFGRSPHPDAIVRGYFARSPGQRIIIRHCTFSHITPFQNSSDTQSTTYKRNIEWYGNVVINPLATDIYGLIQMNQITGSATNYVAVKSGTNVYYRTQYPTSAALFYSTPTYRTLANVQALAGGDYGPYEVGTIYADPLLVDPLNADSSLRNYTPTVNSPARDICRCDLAWDANRSVRDSLHDAGAYEYAVITDPPDVPTDLVATAVATNQINLTWTDVATENSYELDRKTGLGGTWAQIATPARNEVSYSDTGLTHTTTYYYRIRAVNDNGESANSSEANATTLTPSDPTPTPVNTRELPGKSFHRRR